MRWIRRQLVGAAAEKAFLRAFAQVDLRGRQRSEGRGQYHHAVNPHEGPDGYDTVEWIAAQPWSNGRVGTVGVSHGAVVQAALALYQPPHLTAMWLDDGFYNWFTNGARQAEPSNWPPSVR